MKTILQLLFKLSWKIISFSSKIYWFLWRKEQYRRFKYVGKNVHIGRYCHFTPESISIGDHVYIGQECRIQSTRSEIKIGNHVMFGPGVSIHGGNHRSDLVGRYMIDIKLDEKLPENDQDVVIEDDVWIGAHAILLKGVTIGEGSIVGAGTVVSHSIPSYSILVGNKSQKLKERWSEEQIKKHKQLLIS